ncbi:MAG TPA: hydantoinase/oxoprolinase family protein, partial [Methyloceanibacter sp.]|nr:hydantoinase/oxoprolinase family protein [Methyloceanibacter sp.]
MTLMGWDLGGANLKLARVEAGRVVDVAQIPCPVMQDRGKFDAALEAAMPLVPAGAVHAVTMTGELSDVFVDRTQGVAYLVAMMRHALPDQALRFYGGRAGFLATEDAAAHVSDIASANWHATAALAASRVRDGLLVDIGSTTTDLVPFREGGVTARGYSDGERLTDHELIYA